MPITSEEHILLIEALDSFEMADSAATARIIYDTICGATRLAPNNPAGLSFLAINSLGRLIFEKAPWDKIIEVEKAIPGNPVRLPLIKAVDSIFRDRFPKELTKLPDEKKQAISFLLTKMDASELVALAITIYETIRDTAFKADPASFATTGVHPFSKFLSIGWTWQDLFDAEPTRAGICAPLVIASHDIFREKLAMVFRTEEIESAEQKTAEEPAPEAPPITPEEEAAVEAQAQVAPPEEEGGASDTDPFAEIPNEEVEAAAEEAIDEESIDEVEATTKDEKSTKADNANGEQIETTKESSEEPSETPARNGSKIFKVDAMEIQPPTVEPPKDKEPETPITQEAAPTEGKTEDDTKTPITNGNNNHLSKKERREQRRRQKEVEG